MVQDSQSKGLCSSACCTLAATADVRQLVNGGGGQTCSGLVVAQLAHELRNVEDGVSGAFNAFAGSVAARG